MRKKIINPYYQGPKSDHFDGTRFFLPQSVNPANGVGDLLKWQLSGQKKKWPKRVQNADHAPPGERVGEGDFSVTLIGHATVLLQICGLNILTDPFFSDRASPLQFIGPKRVSKPGLAIEKLPPIDVILLSHNHFDHLDLPALAQLHRRFAPKIITPLGNGAIVRTTGLPHHIIEGDWGDVIELKEGLRVSLTPALHWSKRKLNDRNMALWCAFLLQTPFGALYFAGDTGYGDGAHFRDIKDQFGPPRLAFLPIGAYEPRWFMKPQHMNPGEAVRAHLDLAAHRSIGIHHSTVQLTDEAIDAPAQALARALDEHNVDSADFVMLDCGESHDCKAAPAGKMPQRITDFNS